MALGDGVNWNESTPDDSSVANQIDDFDRDLRVGVRSRMALEHIWPSSQTSTAQAGIHSFVSLQAQTGAPSLVSASGQVGCIYVTSSGLVLMFEDSAGTSSVFGFISGDMLMSTSSATRAGWTNISATYDGKFIRVSTGTALATGGADTHTHGAGTYTGPSHTHTIQLSAAQNGSGSAINKVDNSPTGADGTGAVSGTSASGDNVPAYVQVYLWRKN